MHVNKLCTKTHTNTSLICGLRCISTYKMKLSGVKKVSQDKNISLGADRTPEAVKVLYGEWQRVLIV